MKNIGTLIYHQKKIYRGYKLGVWISTQRTKYKEGSLENWKIEKLNQIDFSWAPLIEDWNKQYGYLNQFRKKYPNRWPKQDEFYPSDNPLGKWCSWKRSNKKNLESWQIEKLDAIGFPWNLNEDLFNTQFAKTIRI